jgi:transcription initiation factor TFIIIB Brf1 subunit/transcription initiation factor TFIIB
MGEQIKCPVCGNEKDMSDYHKEYVICSCCGTDLSIYKILADSQVHSTHPENNGKIWKITTAVSAAIAIAAIVLLCIPQFQGESVDQSNNITVLSDSITKVLSELDLANREITNLKEHLSNKVPDKIYIVKKNDSPCKISKKLYGTEARFKEIESIISKPLQPGDTLQLK